MTNENFQENKRKESNAIDPAMLITWMKQIQAEQKQQSKSLRTIANVAVLIGILIVFSMIIGACSVLFSF